MAKMTNREKNMVFFLLIVLVAVVGFKFLVEPQMLAATNNEALYEQLEQEKEIVDLTSTQNSEFAESYEENLAALEELQENIGAYIQDEDLDIRMTNLVQAKGLAVEALSIFQSASGYTAEGLELVTVKSVTMTVYGDVDELLALIETYYDITDCVVVNMSMDTSDETAAKYTVEYGVPVEGALNITVAVYMNVPEVEEVEDTAE